MKIARYTSYFALAQSRGGNVSLDQAECRLREAFKETSIPNGSVHLKGCFIDFVYLFS